MRPDAIPNEIKYKVLPNWNIALNLDKKQVGEGQWQVTGNKAEYITDKITVQYINNEEGIRQNFIVKALAAGGDDEKIMLNIETALQVKVLPTGLQFVNKQGMTFNFQPLVKYLLKIPA